MKEVYCNPVPFSDGKRHTNPDPFILRWCGMYYCYATDEAGVKVSVSEDLVHWTRRGYAITEGDCHHYWAPSVIYLSGTFYMYYSNIPIEEGDCHEEHLKLATSRDPLGPFVYKKTFFDKFSIDSHPVMRGGELYMFYSVNDYLGLESKVAGTCILLDKMLSPEEFAGNPKPVMLPTLPQEIYAADRFGDGRDWYTIEGACPVFQGDRCFLLYSANAYENVDYFVGAAVAETKDDFGAMTWKKYPNDYTWLPLLRRNDAVEGTGHNTVTKSPNLMEDWIIYHGRDVAEGLKPGTEQRTMRIDPLLRFQERLFVPGPSCEEREAPGKPFFSARELAAGEEEDVFFAEAGEFYEMEVWCSAEKTHAGAKYMLYLSYEDKWNFVGVSVSSGQRKLCAIWRRGGVTAEVGSIQLSAGMDFSVPHFIGVERRKNRFRVRVDEDKFLDFHAGDLDRNGKTGICGCFTKLAVHSAVIAKGTCLCGEDLFFLPEFYAQGGAWGDECMEELKGGVVELENGELKNRYGAWGMAGRFGGERTESFTWRTARADNSLKIMCGGERLCRMTAQGGGLSFYYRRSGGRSDLLTDGRILDAGGMKMTEVSGVVILSLECGTDRPLALETEGLSLLEYRNIL